MSTRAKALARFKQEKPKLVPVRTLGFEMAGIADQRFFLGKTAAEHVYAVVVQKARKNREDDYWHGIAEGTSLRDCLSRGGLAAKLDKKGNFVALTWDADMDPVPLLSLLAKRVRNESFFLVVDESDCFWKLSFERGRLVFYGTKPDTDWLKRVRIEARLVTQTMTRAGWKLERRKMAARKKDIQSHYGAALRAEYDMQAPETILSYRSAHFALQLRYTGMKKASYLALEVEDKPSSNRLGMSMIPRNRMAALLGELVECQDSLAPDNWSKWLTAHRKRFKTNISTASDMFKDAF